MSTTLLEDANIYNIYQWPTKWNIIKSHLSWFQTQKTNGQANDRFKTLQDRVTKTGFNFPAEKKINKIHKTMILNTVLDNEPWEIGNKLTEP